MNCSRSFAGTKAVERALEAAGIREPVTGTRDLSGGCIHRVSELRFADGTCLVAKTNDADQIGVFRGEAAGLATLARTGTVVVPNPLAVLVHERVAVLLMEALAPATSTADAWAAFGRDLAALHRADVDGRGYGFDADNHLGLTPQPNTWCDDWVEFNAEHRLGHQLRLACSRDLLTDDESAGVQRVIDGLDRLLPRRPTPALLHGDLWSGNALAAATDDGVRIAVIDPACSIGDGWADIAMMRLFGGFPSTAFDAYAEAIDDHEAIEPRIAVYQLYHVLNHLNLFGRGYVAQAMGLVGKLAR